MGAVETMDIGFLRYSLCNRGGDRIVIEYANYLARQGHSVTIHVSAVDTVFSIDPGVVVDERPMSRGRFLAHAATTKFNHQALVVDIIHLPLLAGVFNRVVYLAQAHDVEYYDNPVVRSGVDLLYRLYFARKPSVIAVCDSLAETFRNRYAFPNTSTVTNGIDRETFFFDPDPHLLETKGNRRAIVFMVRGDTFRKGIDIGKEVLSLLSRTSPGDIEVWICGEQLEGLGLSFPVRNFGVVSDDRLRQILSSADIFLYPSRHEGFGLFPLEAMACGCAVVTTDAVPYASRFSCITTTRIEDVQGLAAGIVRLASDPRLLRSVIDEGMEVSKGYDMARSRIAFASALQEAVGDFPR